MISVALFPLRPDRCLSASVLPSFAIRLDSTWWKTALAFVNLVARVLLGLSVCPQCRRTLSLVLGGLLSVAPPRHPPVVCAIFSIL